MDYKEEFKIIDYKKIKNFGYFPVLSWTVLTTQNKLKITIKSQM